MGAAHHFEGLIELVAGNKWRATGSMNVGTRPDSRIVYPVAAFDSHSRARADLTNWAISQGAKAVEIKLAHGDGQPNR